MAIGNTLKCFSPSEVYLLLKGSDKIARDLINPIASNFTKEDNISDIEDPNFNITPELILRQWGNLVPSMEFRCFVKNNKLIG